MTRSSLIVRYALFAAIATLANLAIQRAVLPSDPDTQAYAIALCAGTVTGLVVKYLLDKRWIFFDTGSGVRTHGRKFTLYTLTGVATTAIFWGAETAFWFFWRTDAMRELGAVLGLTIGYFIKYRLDKRFVFKRRLPLG